jgi:Trk K+ transport system NAD-binding subunit
MGASGKAAYDYLAEKGQLVVGMDIDPDRLQADLEEGRRVVYGDAQDIGLWENLDMKLVKVVLVAMSSNIELKLHVLDIMRKCKCSKKILVLALNDREDAAIREHGGEPVLIPSFKIGRRMAKIAYSEA